MLVGYARVSTQEQTLGLQQDALKKAGCDRIFTDTVSGAKWTAQERVGLSEAIEFMRSGDTLVVWKLDRLGRSLKHLIETVNIIQERGIAFKSLTEQIDTTSSGGKLIFHVFGALAEFERDLIRREQTPGFRRPELEVGMEADLGGSMRRSSRCSMPCMPTRATRLPTYWLLSTSPGPPSTGT